MSKKASRAKCAVPQRDADVSDDTVYEAIAAELTGYYSTIITVASLFLGGVLTLLTTLNDVSGMATAVLALGCAALICAIATTAMARWSSVMAGRYSFAQDDCQQKAECRSVVCARAALWCFVAGLTLVSIGVFVAVLENSDGEETRVEQARAEEAGTGQAQAEDE